MTPSIHPAVPTLRAVLNAADKSLIRSRVTTLGKSEAEARAWVAEQPIAYRLRTYAARQSYGQKLLDQITGGQASRDAFDVTYAELEADHKLHDKVLRAVCLASDVDYIGALDLLATGAEQAAIVTNDPGSVRLSEALEAGGHTLDAIRRDVDKITLAEQEREESIQLATAKDEAEDEVEVNAHGQVLFPKGTDLAKLIVDPYQVETFYQRAVKVESNYVAEKDKFEKDFIEHARQGIDLVSTIEREKGLLETKLARREAETKLALAEDLEREKRAEQRDAERQITELSKRL